MPYYEGFHAVEAMQAASEAAGWECEYRQIEAGQLESHTVFQPVGGSSLLCETANRQLDIAARTPEATVSVLVPLKDTHALINGRRLSGDRIMILAPDIDFHAVSNSGAEVWSIHLRSDLLDDSLDLDKLGTRIIDGQLDALTKFRDAIKYSLESDEERALDHHETRFADLTQRLISGDTPATKTDRYHRRQKRQALARAVEYIEAHLTSPLRMGQICSYAGVSQSTLERLFRREFQQTPYSYLRARRLDAVRRELNLRLPNSGTIADVAIKYGFTHMGRFSSVYRSQFGLLPSEDTQ